MDMLIVPKFRCGVPCLLKISNTPTNPGRQFWCCSNRKKVVNVFLFKNIVSSLILLSEFNIIVRTNTDLIL